MQITPFVASAICGVLMASLVSATDYKSCSQPYDCSESKPICAVIYQDRNQFGKNSGPIVNHGVCVECVANYQCGVGKYCKPEYTIPGEFGSIAGPTSTSESNAFSGNRQLYQGLVMPSTCESIHNADVAQNGKSNPFGNQCFNAPAADLPTWSETVTEFDNGDQVNNKELSGYAQGYGAKTFCGLIERFQPTFTKCIGGFCPGQSNSHYLFNANFKQPGQCIPLYSPNPDQSQTTPINATVVCGQSLCLNAGCNAVPGATTVPNVGGDPGKWNIWTNDIPYTGYCKEGKCQECKTGTTRSFNPSGDSLSQVCLDGKWAGVWYTDGTSRTVGSSATAQATTAAAVFTGLIWMVFCGYGCTAVSRQMITKFRNRRNQQSYGMQQNIGHLPTQAQYDPPAAPSHTGIASAGSPLMQAEGNSAQAPADENKRVYNAL